MVCCFCDAFTSRFLKVMLERFERVGVGLPELFRRAPEREWDLEEASTACYARVFTSKTSVTLVCFLAHLL